MGHGERLEQLDAVQLRHHDVRQDEIHRQSCAEGGEGLRAIRGLAGAVPALSQHPADQHPDAGLVVLTTRICTRPTPRLEAPRESTGQGYRVARQSCGGGQPPPAPGHG